MRKTFSMLATALLLTAMQPALAADVQALFVNPLTNLPTDPEAQLVKVELQPGENSPAHRHNGYVFVFVLSGTLEMQVTDGELMTLQPGDTFYESPADIHAVSRNPSTTDTASFLAFIVKPEGLPVSIPVN